MNDFVSLAKAMLKDPDYRADAERFSSVNNTIVGSMLSIVHGAPRWAAEDAVRVALRQLGKGRKK